jgi:drug/metabolite transporter (DMT)-like permease
MCCIVTTPRDRILIALAFLCICFVWGTTYFGVAIVLRTLPPFSAGAIRFLLASAILYAWLRIRQPRPLAGLPTGLVIVTGVLMCGISNGFTVFAQQGVPSGIAALLNSAIPIAVTLLDWGFFSRRRPAPAASLGLIIGIAGVAVVVSRTGAFSGMQGTGYLAAMFVSAAAWSLGTLMQRGRVAPEQLAALACGQMAAGAGFQCLAAIANGELPRLEPGAIGATGWIAIAYLAFFGSVLTQSSYLWLLSRVPAGKVTTYALVNPVVAMLLGAIFLGEPITAITLFGAVMVLGGVAIVLGDAIVFGLKK